MARKTSDVPTRIYSFHAILRDGEDALFQQLHLARCYQNDFARAERSYREAWKAIHRDHPEIAPLAIAHDAAGEAVCDLLRDLRVLRDGNGQRAKKRPPEEAALGLAVKAARDVEAKAMGRLVEESRRIRKRVAVVVEGDATFSVARAAFDDAKKKHGPNNPIRHAAKECAARAYLEALDRLRDSGLISVADAVLARTLADAAARKAEWCVMLRGKYSASGLASGTYLLVEAAARQAAADWSCTPQIKRPDGSGRVGVHFGGGGISVADLLAGKSGLLRVHDHERRLTLRTLDEMAQAAGVPIGLGSNKNGGRPDPVRLAAREAMRAVIAKGATTDAERVALDVYHRLSSNTKSREGHETRDVVVSVGARSAPAKTRLSVIGFPRRHAQDPWGLPEDGLVKDAWILSRRVGMRHEMRLQIVVESEAHRTAKEPVGRGRVAVDLGWRQLLGDDGTPTGAIRVGYWVDDAGRHGEILLPERVVPGVRRSDTLRATRDEELDALRGRLVAFTKAAAVPEWWALRTAGLVHWRAARRFAALLRDWRERRFDGDTEAFADLEVWTKQDRHLLTWQEHNRDKRIGERRAVWRQTAVRFAKTYAEIIVGDMDLRDFAASPAEEDATADDGREQRRVRMLGAPGELREEMKRWSTKYGATCKEQDMAWDTRHCACADCGHVNKQWDTRARYEQICAGCRKTWDQDRLGATNRLRRASGEAAGEHAEVLANGSAAQSKKNMRRRTRAPSKQAAERTNRSRIDVEAVENKSVF